MHICESMVIDLYAHVCVSVLCVACVTVCVKA